MSNNPPRRRRLERTLTPAERADWDAIARTITPLSKRVDPPVEAPISTPQKPAPTPPRPSKPLASLPPIPVARSSPRLPAVEPRVLRALKRGQIEIEARLDLHGETQASAHLHLDKFLGAARQRGRRVVLVVTGKGKDGDGVLKRMLPHWLGAPPYSEWILGIAPAGPAHGGTGAFYIALRKAR